MTTTKSYLAGLGMTGIVIGSVLVLLAVGTGLVAFEGAPAAGGGRAPLERVIVGNHAGSPGAKGARTEPAGRPLTPTGERVRIAPQGAVSQQRQAAARERGAAARKRDAAGRRDSGRRAARGGGAQVRTDAVLGGGAAAGDASDEGGGAAAAGERQR